MKDDDPKPDDLYEDLERRALFDLPEEEEENVDVVSALKGEDVETVDAARDVSLGGYIDVHNRVPAFEGSDGQPYTVDVDVEETGDAERPFVAFLVFIRWAATGAGIMDHTESRDMASGRSEEEVRNAALELSLYEVKTELDAAIARRREALEE
jgi:hypothetical protein